MRTPYEDAINLALDRLRGIGFEQEGTGFATHAPMAAEALASLGFCDDVPGWVEANSRRRRHRPEPAPFNAINAADERDWRAALGDFRRAADWVDLFERSFAERGWRAALALWWPRLLPGMAAALTHGLIRTAHAVRGAGLAADPTPLQLRELAKGMAYWAARHHPAGHRSAAPAEEPDPTDPAAVGAALSELTAANAGRYAAAPGRHPVPLIHTITAPAALRLVLPHLPPDMHAESYRTAVRVTEHLRTMFGQPPAVPGPPPAAPDPAQLIATAVELADEHAIKLAEAARREHALRPDPRYLAAGHVANQLIAR